MTKKRNTDCPICGGTGKIEDPRILDVDRVEVKREIVHKLHEKGHSLRQIQRALGYKSVRSVYLILKDHGKKGTKPAV